MSAADQAIQAEMIKTIRTLCNALDATRLIMRDQESRDYAKRLIDTAKQVAAISEQRIKVAA